MVAVDANEIVKVNKVSSIDALLQNVDFACVLRGVGVTERCKMTIENAACAIEGSGEPIKVSLPTPPEHLQMKLLGQPTHPLPTPAESVLRISLSYVWSAQPPWLCRYTLSIEFMTNTKLDEKQRWPGSTW